MYLCQYQNENSLSFFFFKSDEQKSERSIMLRCCNLPDIWIIGLEKILRNTFTRIFSFVVHFCFNCNPSFLFFFLIKRFSSGQQ